MIDVRHEKYGDFINEYPFSLGIDIERTAYNCSKEQNWHENLEIQLYTDGKGTVLLDGEKYSVCAGDIIAVNSNVVHYTFTDTYLKYTCLIISTSWCKKMHINYDALQYSPFIISSTLTRLMENLVFTYSNHSDTLRIAKSNEILLSILIELTEHHSTPGLILASKSKKFDVIKATVTFVEKNFNQKITLSKIAEAVLFDKYALCKEFKKYTGKTIVQYLHQYRCIKAIDYLSAGYTVAETAFACGFENLSFFTKTFKRYTGKKPSYYKK